MSRRFSGESEKLLRLEMATQQGDSGYGSGKPWAIKVVHAEIKAVTVLQSTLPSVFANLDEDITTIIIKTMLL